MKLADLLGIASEIEFEGKLLRVRAPSQTEQGLFSRFLERRARDFVSRSLEMEQDEKTLLLRGIAADAAAGTYDWGADAYVRALGTPMGIAKMLHLVLSAENPTEIIDEDFTTRLVAQKVTEIAAVLQAQEMPEKKD